LKLKSLAVITVLTLALGGSSAFAGTYAFGFLNYSGGVAYCNYAYFATGGADDFYLGGFDVLDACPYTANPSSPITGLGVKFTKADIPNQGLEGLVGKGVYAYADSLLDAYYGTNTGNVMVVAVGKPGPIEPKHANWAAFLGFGGDIYLCNYGFLTDGNAPRKTSPAQSVEIICAPGTGTKLAGLPSKAK